MLFKNARLILPDRIQPAAALRVRDGRIAEISKPTEALSIDSGEAVLDARGKFLSPGFLDMHIHGALRRDSMEATPEAFSEICRFHASGGTTSLALTTVSAPQNEIIKVLNSADVKERLFGSGVEVAAILPLALRERVRVRVRN